MKTNVYNKINNWMKYKNEMIRKGYYFWQLRWDFWPENLQIKTLMSTRIKFGLKWKSKFYIQLVIYTEPCLE